MNRDAYAAAYWDWVLHHLGPARYVRIRYLARRER